MRTYSLLITIISIFLVRSVANRAPDVAPELPDGWCVGGRGTRTTGECICVSGECEGPRCIKSALVFYKYTDCPTCRCVSANTVTKAAAGAANTGKQRVVSTPLNPHAVGQFGAHAEPAVLGEDHISYEEWLEDNWRHIFAIVASMMFFGIAGIFVYLKVAANGEPSNLPETDIAQKSN